MAEEAEILTFNRYGHDRLTIRPKFKKITEALGGRHLFGPTLPYMDSVFLKDYNQMDAMEPVRAGEHPRMKVFFQAAEILADAAGRSCRSKQVSAGHLQLHRIYAEWRHFSGTAGNIRRKSCG